MSNDTLELAALIGSRICHDLISPIGAIGNGLELLQMGTPPTPEMALMADSVNNANARIRFFRIAFGKAAGGQGVPLGEVQSILRDMSLSSRIRYEFQSDAAPDRAETRTAFLAVLCVEQTLPMGGEIGIRLESAGWSVTGKGPRIRQDEALWAHLSDANATSTELSPGQVQFGLLPGHLRQMGRSADISFTETSAQIAF